ncbi:hypothetical protein PGT21_008937 [Puccinia graminis f. sp. tritici]|uniref:Uncharacterized protein n=1 Tax=Puccinia graminis f. sp. tritici TaxID=56615 RepID=A0A5B0Q2B2_PUCGR|nr:hypothetical protein PGT21_008937 [Puccinia graminis f. sp. tritici]
MHTSVVEKHHRRLSTADQEQPAKCARWKGGSEEGEKEQRERFSYQATHACHPRSFKPLKGRQQIHITLSRKPPFITATEDNSALSPSYLSAKVP